jgi:hypothetical protein
MIMAEEARRIRRTRKSIEDALRLSLDFEFLFENWPP